MFSKFLIVSYMLLFKHATCETNCQPFQDTTADAHEAMVAKVKLLLAVGVIALLLEVNDPERPVFSLRLIFTLI